jgi:hypothetical protein
MKHLVLTTALFLGALTPAMAGTVLFTGLQDNTNVPAATSAPGSVPCGGALQVFISDTSPFFSAGSSNLGAFTTTQTHCLSGPPPITGPGSDSYFDGSFDYFFAGGQLSGTYYGTLTNDSPGKVGNEQHFTVTGGTGIFAGATGGFLGEGAIDFTSGKPVSHIDFTGTITASGLVPEPGTWAMLICGFGAIGGTLRARRRVIGAMAG